MTRDQRRSVDQSGSTPGLAPNPPSTFGLFAFDISRILFWAAVGGNHPCAQDEPEPVGRRSRKEVLGQLGRNAYAGPGRRAVRERTLGGVRLESDDQDSQEARAIKWFRELTFRNGRFNSYRQRLGDHSLPIPADGRVVRRRRGRVAFQIPKGLITSLYSQRYPAIH
jgi:hypothetical protein